MRYFQQFLSNLSNDERKQFQALTTPEKIQDYLDRMLYRVEDDNVCVLRAIHEDRAHCFDGSILAAAALWQIGYPPVVIQLLPENDDDHMIAIYGNKGAYGAVAKSNYVGLRSREPVYRSIRELIMSYFNDFYRLDGIFSLRGYTIPLNLEKIDQIDWLSSDLGAQKIIDKLHTIRKIRLFKSEVLANLTPINAISYRAGMSISNIDGIYKPGISPKKDFGF